MHNSLNLSVPIEYGQMESPMDVANSIVGEIVVLQDKVSQIPIAARYARFWKILVHLKLQMRYLIGRKDRCTNTGCGLK
jgi:hypothetical protein